MKFLTHSSWILSSLLVVIPSIALCLIILWLVRKYIPIQDLQNNHEVAGFTLGIIGVLYSVILGFTVVNVQTRFNNVVETIHTEAISLADLYREAGFFPEAGKNAIRSSLRKYLEYVVDQEWHHRIRHHINLEAQQIIEQIWHGYYTVDLSTEKTNIWYQQSISKLNAFLNARLARQFNSWESLGSMMWTLLIVGAIITTCFMYFFGLERLPVQMTMTALLVGYISFMLYLVFCLDSNFKGPDWISSTPYSQVIELFDEWDKRENIATSIPGAR